MFDWAGGEPLLQSQWSNSERNLSGLALRRPEHHLNKKIGEKGQFMARRDSYSGGSTVIGPRSGWFSFSRPKPKKDTPSKRSPKARLSLIPSREEAEEQWKNKQVRREAQAAKRAEKLEQKRQRRMERAKDPKRVARAEAYRKKVEDRMAKIEVVRKSGVPSDTKALPTRQKPTKF
jgi:hypothetical protein